MKVTPVTDDVFQLALLPRNGVNAYLVGDAIVDAGIQTYSSDAAQNISAEATLVVVVALLCLLGRLVLGLLH